MSDDVSEAEVEAGYRAADQFRMRLYEWTDDQFEIWWTRDSRNTEKAAHRKEAEITLRAAAQTRASAAETEIAALRGERDALVARLVEAERRGAEAMRERAAKVADGHDGKLRGGGWNYGPNVGPKIAIAILALPATEPQS